MRVERREYSLLWERRNNKKGSVSQMQIRVVGDEQEAEGFTEKQITRAGEGTPKARLRIRNGRRYIEVFNRRGTFKRVLENEKKGNTLSRIQAELREAISINNRISDIEGYVMRKFNEVARVSDKQLMDDFIAHFDGDVDMTENEGSTTRQDGVYFRINYGGSVNAPKPTIDKKLT